MACVNTRLDTNIWIKYKYTKDNFISFTLGDNGIGISNRK